MTKFSTERLAVLDAPVFTGDARAVTAAVGDADTSIATTEFVAASGRFSTGDAKITLRTVADPGWLMMNDGTIGSASSGADYANVLAQALFTLLFTNISDAAAPILTSAGAATTRAAQGSAAAAWTANCRMSLTKQLGRSLAVAGAGSGLTSRALGAALGAETETPTIPKSANHGHTDTGHAHARAYGSSAGAAGGDFTAITINTPNITLMSDNASAVISNTGGGTPLNILDPSSYWNVMIKL